MSSPLTPVRVHSTEMAAHAHTDDGIARAVDSALRELAPEAPSPELVRATRLRATSAFRRAAQPRSRGEIVAQAALVVCGILHLVGSIERLVMLFS